MERKDAINLLKKYNKEEFHLRHALTVESVMRYFAKENGYGMCSDIKPEHEMEKILFATDELTGIIWAAAKMN